MYITFSNPKYLFLLFVIPLFILIHLLSLKKSRRKALSFANFEAISRVKGIEFLSKNLTVFFLNLFVILIVIFAISGVTLHKQADASSFSFIIAIDASRSMEATDLEPTRLDAAKSISKEFVNAAPSSTEIGILSFSGNAYIHSPITKNRNELQEAINSIEISSIEGTDLYEAVITSTNLLSQSKEARAIILLSDGQINVGVIEEAITYANEHDVLIHSIAIGTEEGGTTLYGLSKVNKEVLQALAYNTEGEFFDTENEIQISESFNRILKITKKKVSISLISYFLLVAIVLFMVQYVLINIRYRIFP